MNFPRRLRLQICVKPRKSNVPGFDPPPSSDLVTSLAPKLDQSSLLRVQPQPVLLESLPQHRQDSLGILPLLKTHHE